MSSDLVPYRARSLTRAGRQEAAAIRASELPAKCANARIKAAAAAAGTGMLAVELLTDLEIAMVKRNGASIDDRVRAITDTYSGLVQATLIRLSLE